MPGDAAHDAFRSISGSGSDDSNGGIRSSSAPARNRIYFDGGIGRPGTHYVWVRTEDTRRAGCVAAVSSSNDDGGGGGGDDDGGEGGDDGGGRGSAKL